jgi:hypothetical protein
VLTIKNLPSETVAAHPVSNMRGIHFKIKPKKSKKAA